MITLIINAPSEFSSSSLWIRNIKYIRGLFGEKVVDLRDAKDLSKSQFKLKFNNLAKALKVAKDLVSNEYDVMILEDAETIEVVSNRINIGPHKIDEDSYFRLEKINSESVAYRIIADEPLGFAIGFKPVQVGYEYDRVEYGWDSIGKNAFLIGNKLIFSDEDEINGQHPEPDMLIFKSKEDWIEYLMEQNHG